MAELDEFAVLDETELLARCRALAAEVARLEGRLAEQEPPREFLPEEAAAEGETEPGEMFRPRGIGANWLRCFVCGGIKDGELHQDGLHYSGTCQADMASFVNGYASGKRVREMFTVQGLYCFLDYRRKEPNHVQVKLGACLKHYSCLEHLATLVATNENTIVPQIIAQVVAAAQEGQG